MMGFALCLHAPLATAQGLTEEQTAKTEMGQAQEPSISLNQRSKVTYDAILGPGDGLEIELLDLPELCFIGLTALRLPRLRALYVEGLTVESSVTSSQAVQHSSDHSLCPPSAFDQFVFTSGEVVPGYYT